MRIYYWGTGHVDLFCDPKYLVFCRSWKIKRL